MSGANGNGHRWSKFWWQDWENDEDLKLCSFAAQGVWMRALCLMHKSGGYLLLGSKERNIREISRDLSRLWGSEPRQIERYLLELVQRNVAKVTDAGVLFCQRMVNDFKASADGKEHIKKRWNGHKPAEDPIREATREATPDPITRSLEAEEEEEGGTVSVPAPVPRASARKPRQPLPPDWQPTTREINFGLQYGLQPDEVRSESERLRDWAAANGAVKADWDAFFRNWLRDAVYRKRAQPPPTTDDLRRDWNLPTFLGPRSLLS